MHTTPFTFSIRTAIREGFAIFKRHPWFFVGIGVISLVLNMIGGERTPALVDIIGFVLSFAWSIVGIKVSLAAARGDEEVLTFNKLKTLLPTWKEVVTIAGISVLAALIIFCGFIMLIIPGIYFAFRFSFVNLAYFDRKEGIRASLRYSWELTKGNAFWTVVLTMLVVAGLCILGLLALGVGLFVAYPVAIILLAKLYLALSKYHTDTQMVVEQPLEILPVTPEEVQ